MSKLSGSRFQSEDYVTIVNWLEATENYDLLFGTPKKTTIGAKHPTKSKVCHFSFMKPLSILSFHFVAPNVNSILLFPCRFGMTSRKS